MPPRNRAALIAPSKPRQLSWASAAQQEAFEYGPAPLLLSGGYGASKTFGAVFKVLALSDMYAKNRGVIIRRVGKQLRLTTQATFFKLCPPAAYARGSWNQQEGRLILNNGSEILFLHLDDPSSKDIMRGLEVNWFFFDQAEEAEEEDFDHLLGRLGRWDQAVVPEWMIRRETDAGREWAWRHPETGAPIPPTYPILTANPDHELHWLWRRFHEDSPEWRDKWSALGYKILHMSSLDNKFLPRQNREYLLAQDDAFKRRYVFGKWGIPEGAIHDVPSCQLIPGTRAVLEWVRANCSLYRSMDHGDTSPTCVLWWAVTRAGDVICVAPHTKVLTDDLRWVRADSIMEGDVLAGFDESPCSTGRRRWRAATVLARKVLMQPAYKITLDDGTVVICSKKHQWLMAGHSSRWRSTDRLKVGQRLIRVSDVWDTDRTYEAGYLSAAFDGEGHLTKNQHGTAILGLSQKRNPLLRYVEKALRNRGIRYGKYSYRAEMVQVHVTRKRDILKFLGSIRPKRLMPKFSIADFGGFKGYAFPSIVKIEFLGSTQVVAMETSTRTFIAEGLASHNCYREYYRPNALITDHRATVAALSENERYEGNIADPSIFYKMMQKQMVKFSVADEWSDSTNYPKESAVFWTAGNNDELGTRNRINEYLRVDKERINIFTKVRGAARLYFVVPNRDAETGMDEYANACEHVVRQLRSQRRQRMGTDAGRPLFIDDRDETVPDHAYDPLRYFIATRPSPYPLRVNPHEEQFSFMAVRERAISAARPAVTPNFTMPPTRNIYTQLARFKRRI